MPKISKFDAPIPGESMTLKPKTYPFDRPPKHVNPDDAADEIFDMITEEKPAKSILLLLDSGMPVSFIAKFLLQRAFGEGVISFDMMPLLAGPVGVMVAAMAKAANIDPKMDFDKDNSIAKIIARIQTDRISDGDVQDALEEARKQKEAAQELNTAESSEKSVRPDNANTNRKGGQGLGAKK